MRIIILTVVLLLVAVCLVIGYAVLIAASNHRFPEEQLLEDEDQIAYLRDWCEGRVKRKDRADCPKAGDHLRAERRKPRFPRKKLKKPPFRRGLFGRKE